MNHRPFPASLKVRAQDGGVSIAFIFFTISVFSAIGAVSYSLMSTESAMSVKGVQHLQAQYWAESGIEYGIKKVSSGQGAPYTESISVSGGTINISLTDQDSLISVVSQSDINGAEKGIEVLLGFRQPIGDFAIYTTGEVTNVTPLDVDGTVNWALMVENASFMPVMDDSALIANATAQGHVYVGNLSPSHGYPNFNFYYSAGVPNVTYIQGNLTVNGGRTVYGIFMVDGDIVLKGSSRVQGVLYLVNPNNIIIHGGGDPTESSVTGGIIANGDVDGTGNHITVHYNAEYMGEFDDFEDLDSAREIFLWHEL
jgi:hypothetical protein